MTRDELKKIAVCIQSTYSKEILPDKQSFDVWYVLLNDLDFNIALAAVQDYCATEHFPPVPADIRKRAMDLKTRMTGTEVLGEAEAWNLVKKALGKSTYSAKEEFEKLPRECQKAIGGYETMRDMAMSDSDNLPIYQSNFIKAYRVELARAKEDMATTPQVRALLDKVKKQMLIGEN